MPSFVGLIVCGVVTALTEPADGVTYLPASDVEVADLSAFAALRAAF
jgi:hypothetical protein